MGIQNLLGFMKPFVEQINIKKYAGKRVGIDAYSWLHKGAYSCSLELCLDSGGDKKLRYLQYFMHRINLLRHYNVIPVVVFDGGNIPCKSATEDERRRRRDANLALAKETLDQGNYNSAVEFFQRAVSITPSMAHQLIQILRSENVEFIVAPYEADAQLAYLSNLEVEGKGIAAVITEDSDLLAYGCKAIVFKMDRYGNGDEIVLDKVFSSVSGPPGKNAKPLAGAPSFKNFTKELFTGLCVIAGCDFLPSVTGIGIKRAYSLVSKYKNLDRVLSVLKFEKGNQMPEDYAKSFREAVAVFHHARIFDAGTKSIQPLKPLSEELLQSLDKDLDFLGPLREIPSSMATAIAEGHLNPITMEAFDHRPKVEVHLHSLITQSSDHFSRAEALVMPTEESSYTTFSSCVTREEKIEEVKGQKPNLSEKYSKEAVALHTLMVPLPLKSHQKFSDAAERKEFPCNNPFRKRKLDDIHLDQSQDTAEQVSIITNNQKSEEILCWTPGSQESVKSKPTGKIIVPKALKKNVVKLESKNSCRSSESRNNSILNFFKPL